MTQLDQTLARAVLYRWASRLFSYPTETLIRVLASGEADLEVEAALVVLHDNTALAQARTALQEAGITHSGAAPGVAEEHSYLFARSVVCPPYETSYSRGRELSLGHDLSDLAGFYAAFGVQVSEERRERPDHVSLELEFVSFLYAKEVYALEQDWKGKAQVCRNARDRFLREHLGRWFPTFAERLGQHARLRFYPAVATFAQSLLETEPALAGASYADSSPSRA